MNSIKLLNPELLNESNYLSEISYWLKVMNRPQGWHYDLDIVWLLKKLKEHGLKKGDTILDAGAGMGVTQFILAAKGYNVISLDFSKRKYPDLAEGIFDITMDDSEDLDYTHDYIGFVNYRESSNVWTKNKHFKFADKLYKIFKPPAGYFYEVFKSYMIKKNNLKINLKERKNDHSEFGSIRFIRSAFHDIKLEDQYADALVSVSAIEHADIDLLDNNINEMKRVVKKNGPLLITTSATPMRNKWFHEKTRGWCFTQNCLENIAKVNLENDFQFENIENKILSSEIWEKRLDLIIQMILRAIFSTIIVLLYHILQLD